jgi:3D (Asp-Asp-Asp) domain-containing protein
MRRLQIVDIILIMISALVIYGVTTLLSSHKSEVVGAATEGGACSTGWRITGYFLPLESDYGGSATQTVNVDGKQRTFPSKFLEDSKREGWGKTNAGDYIGNYGDGGSDRWISSPYPKDNADGRLYIGVVAVDQNVVPLGSKLTISTLLAPWNNKTFTATDIGQDDTVEGKHVDIYTGDGKRAEQETFRITSKGHTVCIL